MASQKTLDIENAVTNIVASAGVGFIIGFMGARKNALGGTHEMDEWKVTFLVQGGIAFEYFTGIGHRVDTALTRLARQQLKGCSHRSIAWVERVENQMKPIAPHIAGVLHSLILDSSAARMSFAEWCSDYGYDVDSRKAFATYEACQQNADKLRQVFNGVTIEALQTALQDY